MNINLIVYLTKGTSKPAKYIVLREDHKLSEDELIKMAYYMCFSYCRTMKSISIPIPTKYADLAAYRTKQHMNMLEMRRIVEKPTRDETEQQKRDREKRMIEKLNGEIKIHPNMEFLPYYC